MRVGIDDLVGRFPMVVESACASSPVKLGCGAIVNDLFFTSIGGGIGIDGDSLCFGAGAHPASATACGKCHIVLAC